MKTYLVNSSNKDCSEVYNERQKQWKLEEGSSQATPLPACPTSRRLTSKSVATMNVSTRAKWQLSLEGTCYRKLRTLKFYPGALTEWITLSLLRGTMVTHY